MRVSLNSCQPGILVFGSMGIGGSRFGGEFVVAVRLGSNGRRGGCSMASAGRVWRKAMPRGLTLVAVLAGASSSFLASSRSKFKDLRWSRLERPLSST